MHNGLLVTVNGYYGSGITEMLKKNRGSHEPQEELVFAEALRRLPEGSIILECGAYWAFYSMWFCQQIPKARAFMIEPIAENLVVGRQNFELNGLAGEFLQAYVGGKQATKIGNVDSITIDSWIDAKKLDRLHLLHCDIQGAEVEMLKGALKSFEARLFDYVFISTHSDDLHAKCEKLLAEYAYCIDVSVYPSMSYSIDGVLVGRNPVVDHRPLPVPSLRTNEWRDPKIR